jgi:hypothetical protein
MNILRHFFLLQKKRNSVDTLTGIVIKFWHEKVTLTKHTFWLILNKHLTIFLKIDQSRDQYF